MGTKLDIVYDTVIGMNKEILEEGVLRKGIKLCLIQDTTLDKGKLYYHNTLKKLCSNYNITMNSITIPKLENKDMDMLEQTLAPAIEEADKVLVLRPINKELEDMILDKIPLSKNGELVGVERINTGEVTYHPNVVVAISLIIFHYHRMFDENLYKCVVFNNSDTVGKPLKHFLTEQGGFNVINISSKTKPEIVKMAIDEADFFVMATNSKTPILKAEDLKGRPTIDINPHKDIDGDGYNIIRKIGKLTGILTFM